MADHPTSYDFQDAAWISRYIEPPINNRHGNIPFIIGIGGGSGVGKTTLAQSLARYITDRGNHLFLLAMDDFFISPQARKELDEWGPQHVRLGELKEVLRSIKAGGKQFQILRSIRRPTRQMVPWEINLERVDVIVFEGLYALSNRPDLGEYRKFIDVAIYLKARLDDIKRWRFEQERSKPNPRTQEQMERHWEEGIVPDTRDNVEPTAENADLVFVVDSNHNLHLQKPSP